MSRFAVFDAETEKRIAMRRRLNPMEISQFYEDAVRFELRLAPIQRPDVAMAGAHKARIMLAIFTPAEKETSRNWLRLHNYEVPGET